MKKIMCFLLALSLLMLGLAGAMADSAVYTGSARGMQGEVVVNVTIEDGKITDIQYEKYPETENITYVARDRIPAQIIGIPTCWSWAAAVPAWRPRSRLRRTARKSS